jgi:hypothetical protein
LTTSSASTTFDPTTTSVSVTTDDSTSTTTAMMATTMGPAPNPVAGPNGLKNPSFESTTVEGFSTYIQDWTAQPTQGVEYFDNEDAQDGERNA